jgi:hypothetical protein
MTTIAAMRALVRQDLHDEDSAAYRWTDAVLDRHVQRAVAEYSLHLPLEQKTTLTTTAGSRDIDIASLTAYLAVEAVEWPTGEFPPRLVAVSKWQNILTMDTINAPTSVQNVNVYWVRNHTLAAGSSTTPTPHDDLIATGAAAYAALDWTSYAANRINTGGEDAWGRYKAFGEERLRAFRGELKRLGRLNTVRVRRMYSTDAPSVFEQQRVKY